MMIELSDPARDTAIMKKRIMSPDSHRELKRPARLTGWARRISSVPDSSSRPI